RLRQVQLINLCALGGFGTVRVEVGDQLRGHAGQFVRPAQPPPFGPLGLGRRPAWWVGAPGRVGGPGVFDALPAAPRHLPPPPRRWDERRAHRVPPRGGAGPRPPPGPPPPRPPAGQPRTTPPPAPPARPPRAANSPSRSSRATFPAVPYRNRRPTN